MDYLNAFSISATGMKVERLRLDVTAMNIANANTTKGANGELYSPLRVVSRPTASFVKMMQNASTGGAELKGTENYSVEKSGLTPKKVHDPAHPQSDNNGFVEYPNVNPVDEMVNMISATRSYEANIKAFNAAKTMALKALQIGGDK